VPQLRAADLTRIVAVPRSAEMTSKEQFDNCMKIVEAANSRRRDREAFEPRLPALSLSRSPRNGQPSN
jgi:hypothetical protein